jgi:hypothetical protein
MSSDSISIEELGGGNSPAAKFEKIGDTISGTITGFKQQQQTDATTGKPRFFDSGDPMNLWIINVEVESGETMSLWAKRGPNFKVASGKGQAMLDAIVSACKEAGAKNFEVGGRLAVALTGMGEQRGGLNAPKLYTAQYAAPVPKAESVPLDLFSQQQ